MTSHVSPDLDLLTCEQVAELLQVNTQWVRKSAIPKVYLSHGLRKLRYRRIDVENFVRSQRQERPRTPELTPLTKGRRSA